MLYLDKTAYGGCYYNKIAFNNPIEPNPPSEQIEPSVYADMTGGGSLTGNKSPVLEQDIYFMDDVIQGENQSTLILLLARLTVCVCVCVCVYLI